MRDALHVPDWDVEQLEVIFEKPGTWQLVQAGPGTGKSAVACQRIAYLIDEGVSATRILVVSFTRTAVAELRDRIVSYAAAGDRARSVRLTTLDAHAWSLRSGFDDEPLPKFGTEGSHEASIERTVEMFRSGDFQLFEFMTGLEHVIIDEAQDIVGLRAELILEMLGSLSDTCGVTILADSAQAIYGFTSDVENTGVKCLTLVGRLKDESPRPIERRNLQQIHRTNDPNLIDLFEHSRREVESANDPSDHIAKVQKAIRERCHRDIGSTRPDKILDFLKQTADSSTLVLFRRRADVLVASSYCSEAGFEHRIRMSQVSQVVEPWLGWLFGETTVSIMGRDEFEELWMHRFALEPAPFGTRSIDDSWAKLHRLAAGKRPSTIDLLQLRSIVSRKKPPVELCYPDLGHRGPILGTIHASKGREADTVVLAMPPPTAPDGQDSESIFEEGRVYYVGATRARRLLFAAANSNRPAAKLDSSRIFRKCEETSTQIEIGLEDDVDRIAHLAWSNAQGIQQILARSVERLVPVKTWSSQDNGWVPRLQIELKDSGVKKVVDIGSLSTSFKRDVQELWGKIDEGGILKPAPIIPHLYLIAVGTVALSDTERNAVRPPYQQSGFALAPVVKGFPKLHFFRRSP